MIELKKNQSMDNMAEKEYHFDESVGVSLTEHVENLQIDYPKAKIQTRRDRDGFAIIKVSYKPEFKYNLDEILAFDPEKMQAHQAETLEALLQAVLPEGPEMKLQKMDPSRIQQTIKVLTGQATYGNN